MFTTEKEPLATAIAHYQALLVASLINAGCGLVAYIDEVTRVLGAPHIFQISIILLIGIPISILEFFKVKTTLYRNIQTISTK